jgi:hypothetical protein
MSAAKASGGGCCGLMLVMLVIGAVVAGAISLAALVDPFNWMPTVILAAVALLPLVVAIA